MSDANEWILIWIQPLIFAAAGFCLDRWIHWKRKYKDACDAIQGVRCLLTANLAQGAVEVLDAWASYAGLDLESKGDGTK